MDTRKDKGDYYPGGGREGVTPERPNNGKVDCVNLGEIGESYTLKAVKEKLNEVVRAMAPAAVSLMVAVLGAVIIGVAGLSARSCRAGTAPLEDIPNTYPVVTNEEDAVAMAEIASATNASTKHADSALSKFAVTGTVARALSYGTTNHWTDAAGSVWEVSKEERWRIAPPLFPVVEGFEEDAGKPIYLSELHSGGNWWAPMVGEWAIGYGKGDPDSTNLSWTGGVEAVIEITATRELVIVTNLVGRVALTNDIAEATNALHEAIAPTIDYSTSNTTLVATIEAKAPAPDFTTNNVALTKTITQVAPAPADYDTVHGRAMNTNDNFLAKDGGYHWKAEKYITLENGILEFDNTSTHGGRLSMGYESLDKGTGSSARWEDVIKAANNHATNDYATLNHVYTKDDTYSKNQVDAAFNGIRIEMAGSNVWFVVTNYQRTVAGVVPSLQLYEVRNGVTNCVYHSTEEVTNIVTHATNALDAAISAKIPSTAWSAYQSRTGAANPQSNNVTIVSTPSVLLTGGGEWTPHTLDAGGTVWTLESNGLTSIGGTTNGYFRIVDAITGEEVFSVEERSITPAPPVNASFTVKGDGTGFIYSVYAGTRPTLYTNTNLTGRVRSAWDAEGDDPNVVVNSWTDNGNGTWTCDVTLVVPANSYFAYAAVRESKETVITHKRAASFDGGIYINGVMYTNLAVRAVGGYNVLTVE